MGARLFTADEQERLTKRSDVIAQAFMWTRRIPVKDKALIALKEWAALGLPLLVFVVATTILICYVSHIADAVRWACLSSLFMIMIEFIYFANRFVANDESSRACPPVFIFYNDKLYKISSIKSENGDAFTGSDIPKIPSGELFALRQASGKSLTGVSNAYVEAECLYLEVIEQHELGNDNDKLTVTDIEDIVEVEKIVAETGEEGVDEDSFVIEYEKYGEPVRMRLSMQEWGELYSWLINQLAN